MFRLTHLVGFGAGVTGTPEAPAPAADTITLEMMSSQGQLSGVKPLLSIGSNRIGMRESAAIPRSSLIRMPFWEGASGPGSLGGIYDTTLLGGASWVDTQSGIAVNLDGTGDGIALDGSSGTPHPLKIQFPHTMEIIIVPNILSVDRNLFANDSTTAVYSGIGMQTTSGGFFRADYGSGSGTGSGHRRTHIATTTGLTIGQVHHCIVAARGITDISMWVDGVLQSITLSGSLATVGYSASSPVEWGPDTRISVSDGAAKMIYFDFCDYAYSDEFIHQRFLDPFAPLRLRV